MTEVNTPDTGTQATGTSDKPKVAPHSALVKAKDTASHALDVTRDGARDVARRTTNAIESNPLPMLIGGLAIGAIAAAFAPRTAREQALLGPLGKRLTERAKLAFSAARDTGKAELATIGLSRTAASDQAGKLVGAVLKALATAGVAAASAAKSVDGKASGAPSK